MTYSQTPFLALTFLLTLLSFSSLSAQSARTGLLFQAGPATPFSTSTNDKLNRAGLALRVGIDRTKAPTFAGFYTLLGAAISHDRFRQNGASDVSVLALSEPVTTVVHRGQKVRLVEASLYAGGGWNYNRFDVRLRGGIRYLVTAYLRGFEELRINDVRNSFNNSVFRGGLNEELSGTDGRYRVGFPDRYALDLSAELFYQISRRWQAGFSLSFIATAPNVAYSPSWSMILPKLTYA